MKLLLISVKSEVTRGGIAVWTEQFLSRCAAADIDCRLVNTEITGSRAATGKRSLFGELSRTRRIFRDLKTALAEEPFDAVHLNTSCGTFGLFRDYLLAKYIKRRHLPLVVQYHCEIPYWVRRHISRFVLGKLARLSNNNAVLDENSRLFLKQQYGLDATNIPNFISRSIILEQPKEIRPNIEHVFFVGRVEQTKGVRELCAVAEQLPHITFDLLGNVGASISQTTFPPNVHLLGSVPHNEVLQHLDRADLFLLPSHTEGCSIALLESLARGVPVVATDVGSNSEVLAGGCGIVVPKHDVEAMVAAIEFLDRPKQRAEMSVCAVKKAKQEYTEDNVLKLLDLFNGK